ncbi:HNH endonuclease [Zavarzinia aquatilis]|uniref:HNH nuclease domain-containing protein n=1 Tax=Zavarzinia aquatilis TaxID=2211142 RepID=A0A317DVB3_9PROT|nr:HNH endonuclease [Zavarzinia aquatilis]PWR17910.1 hypothetical protein DKG74_20320 [Zavarzinia aquatilis]
MEKQFEPNVPFVKLEINIPDYVKQDGSTASQPFSKSKHDLYRPRDLKVKGNGDGDRTNYFKLHLVRMREKLGRPVPYRFRDAEGRKRSMDAGCLKFVNGQGLATFVLDNGYIVAVDPTPALIAEFAERAGIAKPALLVQIGAGRGGIPHPPELKGGSLVSIPKPADIANDLKDIWNDTSIGSTSRQQLIDARIGQGTFRKEVLRLWGGQCAVTGCDLPEAIRASHIVPWRSADNRERLTPANGLPLIATLDALFDAGLISFDDDGNVLFAPRLDQEHRKLVPAPRRLTRVPSSATKAYLARHRAEHGFRS